MLEDKIPARMKVLQNNYHEAKKKPPESKARFVEAAQGFDALNELHRVAERSDTLIEMKIVADIATEGGLICDGMMERLPPYLAGNC